MSHGIRHFRRARQFIAGRQLRCGVPRLDYCEQPLGKRSCGPPLADLDTSKTMSENDPFRTGAQLSKPTLNVAVQAPVQAGKAPPKRVDCN